MIIQYTIIMTLLQSHVTECCTRCPIKKDNHGRFKSTFKDIIAQASFMGAGGAVAPKEKEKKKKKEKEKKEKKKEGNHEWRQITTYKVLFFSNFQIVRWH